MLVVEICLLLTGVIILGLYGFYLWTAPFRRLLYIAQ